MKDSLYNYLHLILTLEMSMILGILVYLTISFINDYLLFIIKKFKLNSFLLLIFFLTILKVSKSNTSAPIPSGYPDLKTFVRFELKTLLFL